MANFCRKKYRLQVLRMLIMRRGLYTSEILSKLLGEKTKENRGTYLRINDLVPAFFY